jgi:hypothetical protein
VGTQRDAEYKSPASAVAEAPISLEEYDAEYTEAEGDDEMADETEVRVALNDAALLCCSE